MTTTTTMSAASTNNRWTGASLRAALAQGPASYAGQLADLSHEQFVQVVERHGGRYVAYTNRGRFAVLVVGGAGLPVLPSGEPMGLAAGARLIGEQEFARLLDVPLDADGEGEGPRLYTASTLAELLGVPEARVNAWAKAGLIRPASADEGVLRFEFRQAAVARTLSGLTAGGVSIDRLRRTLQKLQKQMPDLAEPLQQLTVLERNGPLLVRLESGELAEVTGQLQLEFDADQLQPDPPPSLRLVPQASSAEDSHDRGVAHERAGRLAEAEQAYREALLLSGPAPQLVFDLAGVLAKQGRAQQAIERYRLVTELDPRHADAWNNLGILLADPATGAADPPAACDAFRHALDIDPEDPRAHYNLAETLDDLGYPDAAAPHWRAYLRFDPSPTSPWAAHARNRLRGSA